jgi:hypothetical protein
LSDRFKERQIARLKGTGAVFFLLVGGGHTYLYAANRL